MKMITSLALSVGLLLSGCAATATSPASVSAVKVTRVIDGDTIELENKQKVRLLGVDTPERGQCGFQQAKKNMQDMVLAKRIILVSDGKQTTDKYGRLLRYVDLGDKDIGLEQIKDGLAKARYDSRDGYPKHSRQDKYIKADADKKDLC